MGAYHNEATGHTTFDTDYIGAWHEEQNRMTRLDLRDQLNAGLAVSIDFQPGDGTRYRFLLVRFGEVSVVANDGRQPRNQGGDSDVLCAIVLNGMGDGVGTFNRAYTRPDLPDAMENIRYRISDKMSVPNVCTVEALAATIYALWIERD